MRRLVVLLICGLLLSSCAVRPAAEAVERPVIVLIDLSGSTEGVASTYRTYVQKVVDSLKGGEHLLVLPISGASLTAAAAVDLHLPPYQRFTTNSFTHARSLKKLKAEAMAGIDALLNEPRTEAARHTAIIDGLLQARDLAAGRPGATICIISDMVEDSDLARFDGLAAEAIPGLLEQIEAGGRLPRFPEETRVHVAGLSAAGTMDSTQVLAIRGFWEAFFTKAGARLVEYGPEFHNL